MGPELAMILVCRRRRYQRDTCLLAAPKLGELVSTLTLRGLVFLLVVAILVAAATRQLNVRRHLQRWPVLLCASLALVPILILYGLSVGTSIHVLCLATGWSQFRGIALCWAFVASRIESTTLRLLFCLVMVSVTVAHCFIIFGLQAPRVQLEICIPGGPKGRFCGWRSSADL